MRARPWLVLLVVWLTILRRSPHAPSRFSKWPTSWAV
jgi:hypothetical protein